MSAAPSIADALVALTKAFSAAGVRWYVFGAQAVVLYGQPRLTADLDVTVEGTPESVLALLPTLRQHGFEPRLADAEALLRRARVLPLIQKVLAGRPKDLDDARGVLREQGGRLDLERSRRFLRLLEQALDRSDLVDALDRLR